MYQLYDQLYLDFKIQIHFKPENNYQYKLSCIEIVICMYFVIEIIQHEKEVVAKFALALGFTPGNVSFIVDKALSLLLLNVDADTFIYEMTNMNK